MARQQQDYQTGTTTAVCSLFSFMALILTVEQCLEHLAQLQQLCNGSTCIFMVCLGCEVCHRKYFVFSSVGSLVQFSVLMISVPTFMGELPNVVYFEPSPETHNIYNLILQS
jgi:hypothetical protein